MEPTALSGPQQALSRANPEQREKGEFEEKHSILSLLGKTVDPTDELAVTFKCVCVHEDNELQSKMARQQGEGACGV